MLVLPSDFTFCARAASPPPFDLRDCFLLIDGGRYVPPGNSDPCCRECSAWIFLREQHALFILRGGERMGLRRFREERVTDNSFSARVKETARWSSWTTEL
jgi:hypothetical protein